VDFFETVLRWGPLALMAANLFAYVVIWVISRTLVSKDDVVEIERRLIVLEQAHRSAPGWGVLEEIRRRLGAIEGETRSIAATVTSLHEGHGHLREQIETINQHLLDAERK
jgi:hypothetical protein